MPTNDYSKNIVYLSKEQYQTLISNKTLTVNGQTIVYNDSDIYVTPQAEPVTDIRINSTSVVTNSVANMPVADSSTFGVVKVGDGDLGISTHSNGLLRTLQAYTIHAKGGTDSYRPITPEIQHASTFYGLAKAAGADMASSSNPVGTYTDAAKQKIQNMLGITSLLSTEETTTATAAHALNSLFLMGGKLYKATAAIAIGDAVVEGTNCEVVKIEDVFIKNTDYASTTTAGVAKIGDGLTMDAGTLKVAGASSATVKTSANTRYPIVPSRQHESVFYGLSKVAGVDLKDETVTVGIYPETSKTAIRSLIGAAAASDIPSVPVQDVQVNGTSIISNGVANIPHANATTYGVAKFDYQYGINVNETPENVSFGVARIYKASDANIKGGDHQFRPIVPYSQHQSVFYGLAKAAGSDMANSSNAVGTYTDDAKTAIRNMLGATSNKVIAIQDEQPTDTDTKVWLPETQAAGIQVPTMEDMENYVQKTDYATNTTAGVVKTGEVVYLDNENKLRLSGATATQIKNGANTNYPITPSLEHSATFYGLAKAAGDTTQASSENAVGTYTATAKSLIRVMLGLSFADTNNYKNANGGIMATDLEHHATFYGLAKAAGDTTQASSDNAVGTYTADASAAIRNMLGAVGKTDYPPNTGATAGVVKVDNTYSGVSISGINTLVLTPITDAIIKSGTSAVFALNAQKQHQSVFYGLAKAAGDTTQSASSNAVGTYTTEAKSAIQSMLGVESGVSFVENISGTTPTIIGEANTRYMCGELSLLNITPPQVGTIDIIFSSGSTPTVLTLPSNSNIKWPQWFDPTALESDMTYEINIMDNMYGAVMAW